MTRFPRVRALLDGDVASGRLPGYSVALRHGGRTELLVGGTLGLDDARPVEATTPFRLASVTKLFAAVLAMTLVEDGTLALDDPVLRWVPELAGTPVLRDRYGPLHDTVPVARPMTVGHLLTSTPGFGGIWQPCPLADAIDSAGVGPGPYPPGTDAGEFVRRLSAIPLAGQPGELWLYHVPSDLLGVVLARATGRPLAVLLTERVLDPLGCTGTGFHADASVLPTAYLPGADGGLDLLDPPDGRFAAAPAFEGLAAGLVSTASDVLALLAALADGGGPVLRTETVAAMTTEQLTPAQRAPEADFLGEGLSWGLHVGVDVGQDPSWGGRGRFGWDGGTGTSAWADPARDVVGVLLTQRGMGGPEDSAVAFWRAVAQDVG